MVKINLILKQNLFNIIKIKILFFITLTLKYVYILIILLFFCKLYIMSEQVGGLLQIAPSFNN
jgi:hypothetical protein